MTGTNRRTHSPFTLALEAIDNLWVEAFAKLEGSGQIAALVAHSEIETRPPAHKTGPFYQQFVPLRNALVALLAESYRRYFKLALAHPRQAESDPDKWAWSQLQPAVGAALDLILDWYMLACDGVNQSVRPLGTMEFAQGQTSSLSIPLTVEPYPPSKFWRAPAWLFAISLAYVGVGPLKEKHVPATDSEEKLGAAHTRLLLKGARRVFLWELGAAIERVRNEETAAAGAIPAEPAEIVNGQTRRPIKRKGWEQREKLYRAIRQALSRKPTLEGMEFCAELDKRHAPPLYDWMKNGEWREGLTWKEAWREPGLRKKIRRVRQEAMKDR